MNTAWVPDMMGTDSMTHLFLFFIHVLCISLCLLVVVGCVARRPVETRLICLGLLFLRISIWLFCSILALNSNYALIIKQANKKSYSNWLIPHILLFFFCTSLNKSIYPAFVLINYLFLALKPFTYSKSSYTHLLLGTTIRVAHNSTPNNSLK